MTAQDLQDLLFSGVDGYSLSSRGRERASNYTENMTYGEITPDVTRQMLTAVGAKDGETFYDLGAGTGKGVIYAAFLFNLGKSVGVELLEELAGAAQQVLDKYNNEIRPQLPPEKHTQHIAIVNDDMLKHDFSDADIVYTHCTCFSPELMAGITQRCEQLKPGARVITVSKGMESPHLQYIGSEPCQMGWGCATLYFYKRV